MFSFYFDTSAFYKRYREEEGTAAVDKLFSSFPPKSIATSFLTLLEIQAQLTRRHKGGEIPAEALTAIKKQFSGDLENLVSILPLESPYIDQSAEVIDTHALRAPDAIQFSSFLAAQRIAGTRSWILVASDQEIVRAAKERGLELIDPQDKSAMTRIQELLSKLQEGE